jgi:hypothetical protein
MPSDLYFINKVANQWKNKEFELRYARLLVSMSRDQAKEILGFPPRSNPSEEEIKKNYKMLALKNHPDRGGDLSKMVDINVAKDVLTGKQKETWEPRRNPEPKPNRSSPRPEPEPEPEPEIVVMKGQGFSAAWSSNTPPSNTEWKFVSTRTLAFENSFGPFHHIWVLYGKTDTKHILCAIKRRGKTNDPIPTKLGKRTIVEEDWQVSWISAPIKQILKYWAPNAIISVATSWVDIPKGFIPTTRHYIRWDSDKAPTEGFIKKIPLSGGVSLRGIIDIIEGVPVENETPSGGKKIIVEVFQRRNPEGKAGTQRDIFLRINGKEVQLEKETAKKLLDIFIPHIIGWGIEDEKPIQLNRIRRRGPGKAGPYEAFKILSESLTSEPGWVHDAINQMVQFYKPKTASIDGFIDLLSSVSLKTASEITGAPMLELITLSY